MYKKISFLLFLSFLLISISGCRSSGNFPAFFNRSDYPVNINGVMIKNVPKRVIILSDSLADILIATGYKDRIIGRSDECSQEEIYSCLNVGLSSRLDYDKIQSLSPDLVLYDSNISNETEDTLRNMNIKLLKINTAYTNQQLKTVYSDIGAVLGGNIEGRDKGERVLNNIWSSIEGVTSSVPKRGIIVTACYLYNEECRFSNDEISSTIIESAGAVNISKDIRGEDIEIDTLKIADPDYIFCPLGVKSKIMENSGLSDLNAVKNDKVYEIYNYMMYRRGKTMVDTVSYIAEVMYPELNGGIVPELNSFMSGRHLKSN